MFDTNDVHIQLRTDTKIEILTGDVDYIESMREEFTRYVDNFQFMPTYRSGRWNGKTCMINKYSNTMPYGLLFDFIRTHKKNFPRNKLTISDEVKSLFKGPKLKPKYDLKLKPYGYQEDCIMACLNYTKGIIRSATASGKSLVITYIIKTLLENKTKTNVKKALIIVSGKQLMAQFIGDFKEYGLKGYSIGKVYADSKEWDKDIVVSTWQTLSKNKRMLENFGCIVVDECHGVKAYNLKNIMKNSTNARYRLGFTGTMHSSELDNWNVKSYTGPILREYTSGFLAEKGYISKCNVNMLNIEYQRDEWEGSYNDIKDEIFTNEYRVNLITKLSEKLDHNVLILVGKVEKEGDFLKEELKNIKNKTCIFLSGRDDLEKRENWRKECLKRKDLIIVATYGIFQQGINIPNLKYVILAAPFKSKIRVLQSIGRALRKHTDKEEGAIIYDINDNAKFFSKYSTIKLRYYDKEGFNVKEHVFIEGDEIDINKLI